MYLNNKVLLVILLLLCGKQSLTGMEHYVPIWEEGTQPDGIYDYNPTRDKDEVLKIAETWMPRLVGDSDDYNAHARKELLEKHIIPTLEDPHVHKKVYLVKGIATGFITYSIADQRGYLEGFASIHHLAVNTSYQNQGHGSTLLNTALQDCHKTSVQDVYLSVQIHPLEYSHISLRDYYEKKHGFSISSFSYKPFPFKEKSNGILGTITMKKRIKPSKLGIWIINTAKKLF